MKYYIDEDRIIQAIHEDNVVVPDDAYPVWSMVQTDGVYQLGEVLPEIAITVADYDTIMEEHIYNARYARGYTLREPTEFVTSSIPRWKQDAEDFVLFRDTVLAYGLEVMNHYAATGEAPTLEEFKNNLPNIVWTYNDDNNNNGDETE